MAGDCIERFWGLLQSASPVDFSIIIINHKRREMTLDCLRSLPEGPEVIVVDNGSGDGSVEAVRAAFPAAKLIEMGENAGFARAVNRAMREATGRYVLLLNNDATLGGPLDAVAKFLDARPDVAIVGAQLLHADGRRQNSVDNFPDFASTMLNKSLLRALLPGRYVSKHQVGDEPMEVENVIGAAIAVRREFVEKVGPLDEDYFLYFEETDWCKRARDAGWKVMILPEWRVTHRQGQTRDLYPGRADVEHVRSLYTFFRKHRRGSYAALRVLYPVRVFALLILWTLFAAVTLGFWPRARRRWRFAAAVFFWHLAGCGATYGLRGS